MSPFDTFIAELLADPAYAFSACEIRKAFDAVDIEGDGKTDAIELARAIEWICNQRQHSVDERMAKLHALSSLRGKVRINNLREWCGW
jgi:hypothetical protein